MATWSATSRGSITRTRPYRPQTNGKAERFNRTLLEEWAYIRDWTSEHERRVAYEGFLHSARGTAAEHSGQESSTEACRGAAFVRWVWQGPLAHAGSVSPD